MAKWLQDYDGYDVTTSLRHRKWSPFFFFRCAFVQYIILPNLVTISQETKKFIALQVGWWGGGGVVVGVINRFSYILQPGVAPLSDHCFDSEGVSFRVGKTLPGC